MTSIKRKFQLLGIKKLLLPPAKDADSSTSGLAHALFGPAPKTAAGERGRDVLDFLKQIPLFEDLSRGDLRRLARIVHERTYRDGEYIYEQGTPGVAMFLVRSGVVEIMRRRRNGEELPLATLEPPASLDEVAATGAEVVRWFSARARGPVALLALGRSDLDALSQNFPLPANKVLMKLASIMAMRLQTLVEAEYFTEEQEESEQ